MGGVSNSKNGNIDNGQKGTAHCSVTRTVITIDDGPFCLYKEGLLMGGQWGTLICGKSWRSRWI
jgi:hypothetical protein